MELASIAAFTTAVCTVVSELILYLLRSHLFFTFRYFFSLLSPNLTLNIHEMAGMTNNEVFDAAKVYLSTKKMTSSKAECLKVSKTPKEKDLTIVLEKGEKAVDYFDDVQLIWRLTSQGHQADPRGINLFELSFKKKYREKVQDFYLPFVLSQAKEIKENKDRPIKIYSQQCPIFEGEKGGRGSWGYIILDHPATFDTLAMDQGLKNKILYDLDRFRGGQEYYKKVGKPWKRGYLLYGPPGTGKSSLVAAMANHLRFDVYDLRLTGVRSDSDLKKSLLTTTNRSILLIEDIDCSSEVVERNTGNQNRQEPAKVRLTLSGILDSIDGLWSSCGDERIIVFTTNNKDRLDPALLRPGRMDLHINMSYCTTDGFKVLASNYLDIDIKHSSFFGEIDGLLRSTEVTPAEVTEELMKNYVADADAALQCFVKFLQRRRNESNEPSRRMIQDNEFV